MWTRSEALSRLSPPRPPRYLTLCIPSRFFPSVFLFVDRCLLSVYVYRIGSPCVHRTYIHSYPTKWFTPPSIPLVRQLSPRDWQGNVYRESSLK